MTTLEISQLCLRYAAFRIVQPIQRSQMMASLQAQGQQTPLLVQRDAETLVLIDGYLRVESLQMLGEDCVEVIIVDLCSFDALLMGHRLASSRPRSPLEEAWVLHELTTTHGASVSVLASKLDRCKSWVSRRLSLVRVLPESVQEAVRRGQISSQAAMKSLVPLARANATHCARLVEQLGSRRLSVREFDRLYRGWLNSSPEVRARIVEQPELFVRAEALCRPVDPLLRDLKEMATRSRRIQKNLEDTLASTEAKALEFTWLRTLRAFEDLKKVMEVQFHDGS